MRHSALETKVPEDERSIKWLINDCILRDVLFKNRTLQVFSSRLLHDETYIHQNRLRAQGLKLRRALQATV